MPRLVTMEKIEQRCVQRADLENDLHISHAEWLVLISESYGELCSIVSGTGLRYFEREETLTTDGTNVLVEPSAIQALLGIWYAPASGRRFRLRPIQAQELGKYAGQTGVARRYELIDDEIKLYPTPPTGQDYLVRYVPQAPDLSDFASDDCVDVVAAEGEAFLIWCTAVKAKSKSESDTRLAEIERDRMEGKVRDWAINRLMLEPQRVIVDHDDGDDDEGAWGYQ